MHRTVARLCMLGRFGSLNACSCHAMHSLSLSLLAQVRPFLIDTVVLSEEDLDVDAASADDDMREFLVAKV